MYGDYKEIHFEPPHVLIFSNTMCPREDMSEDRWVVYMLNNNQLIKMSSNKSKLTNIS